MNHFPDTLSTVAELIKIATSLSTEPDLQRLLNMIVTSARTLTHAEVGMVYLLDHTKRHLYVEVYQNTAVPLRHEELPQVPLYVADKPHLTHCCAYSACTGSLVQIADIYQYSGFDCSDLQRLDRATAYRTTSVLVVPLRTPSGVTVGVLQLANCHEPTNAHVQPFPATLESVVTAFAAQAAMAIDNVRLLAENRRLVALLGQRQPNADAHVSLSAHLLPESPAVPSIIGVSQAMRQVFNMVRKVCSTDATVLLHGETGTGKELLATTIHHNSPRRQHALISHNCAALPADLLESEFFGYRRGAFTGANTEKQGLLEAANGGTLFLDEIGDMPLSMQAKFLRVIQEGEVRPLGAVHSLKVDIRLIAATHRDLHAMVAARTFREDLYYRLCVFPIDIPPLRARKDDLPALLAHTLTLYATQYHKSLQGFTPRAFEAVLRYDYPGNVRELKNILERAVLLCDAGPYLDLEHLPASLQALASQTTVLSGNLSEEASLPAIVRQFEMSLIEQTLRQHNWNQTKTAQALRVPRRTLLEKMQRYAIKR